MADILEVKILVERGTTVTVQNNEINTLELYVGFSVF